ncbi:MAG: hypothetical protein ACSLE1_20795 [Sphingobium sp.]
MNIHHRRKANALRHAVSAAALVVAMTVGTAAAAQCAPNPTQADQPTECEGLETGSLIVATDGASVIVEQGAQILVADNASIVVSSAPSSLRTSFNTSSTLEVDGNVTNLTGRGILIKAGTENPSGIYHDTTSSSITLGSTGSISAPTGIEVSTSPNGYYARANVILENSGIISSSTGGYALLGSSDATARFESILNSETGTIGAISGQVGCAPCKGGTF